ncbi:MAG: type II toxin-antitoxin system HigB family toxin [Spirochaetes bacterium]|nr:type II toxin-antitoxin system HigB family toxin [Spirochaetota bacterium]
MRVISRKVLHDFWLKAGRHDSEQALKAWLYEAKAAKWKNSAEIKVKYRTASIINIKRVVFNICGNKYRLIVAINYQIGIVFIRFIGTHTEYDRVNPEEV